jgi:hypothetical protein
MIQSVQRRDTCWTAEESGFDYRQEKEAFLFSTASTPALGATQPLFNGYRGLFPRILIDLVRFHEMVLNFTLGRGIAQAVSRRLPTAAARVRAQVIWELWWTKWHWDRFSPSTSVSPVNSHSTVCSTFIIIYHPGLAQQTS